MNKYISQEKIDKAIKDYLLAIPHNEILEKRLQEDKLFYDDFGTRILLLSSLLVVLCQEEYIVQDVVIKDFLSQGYTNEIEVINMYNFILNNVQEDLIKYFDEEKVKLSLNKTKEILSKNFLYKDLSYCLDNKEDTKKKNKL